MKEQLSSKNSILVKELKKAKKEKVMFYIDTETQVLFKKFCVKNKIRMSSVIEKLITNFLNEVKGDNKNE